MRFLILAALFLGGCAMTPVELEQQGTRMQFNHAKAPEAVMQCFLRNVENDNARLSGRVRAGTESGVFEALIYQAGGDGLLLNTIARAKPAGRGATSDLFLSPYFFQAGAEKIAGYLRSC